MWLSNKLGGKTILVNLDQVVAVQPEGDRIVVRTWNDEMITIANGRDEEEAQKTMETIIRCMVQDMRLLDLTA